MPLVVGVAGLSVIFPHSHSTHVWPLFSLMHSSLACSLSRGGRIISSCVWSSPPLPSSSWSSSCSCTKTWSFHAHARGSGAFLTRRAVAISLHTQGLCVGFAHAGSKRNCGCRLRFSVQEPSRAQGLCVSSLTDFWPVYMFPSMVCGLVEHA